MKQTDLIKKTNIQRIADTGERIYTKIKDKYEPKYNNNFLAINTTNKEVFLGKSSSEAVEKAKNKYPETIFYVVKIGSSASEILADLKANK